MQLTTRSVRNLAFATMVAVTPLAQFEEVSAQGQECGVYGPCGLCGGGQGWLFTHCFECNVAECNPPGGCG